MKNKLLTLSLLLSAGLSAQVFTDDFESYTVGDYLASSSSDWTTWSGNSGGTDDVKIVDTQASSGANSIYFASSLQNGGLTDVVLPFAAEYNTGDFYLETKLRVGTGKNAYFNLQETSTIGESWNLNFNFNTNGTFTIDNPNSGEMLNGTYSQGNWFTVKVTADLNTSSWELLFDGVSQGTFQNPTIQVASMNIYPIQGAGFWMDDVTYDHSPYTLLQKNLGIVNIGNTVGLAGQNRSAEIKVRNLGTDPITSFDLTLDYNGNQIVEQVTGVNIASLDVYDVLFTDEFFLVAGSNDMTVTISNVNGAGADDNNSDDSQTITLDPLVPAPGKIVLAEEATGTWCGFCPRGAVFMERMSEKYGHFFAGVAVHNNDPMADPMYDTGLGTLISGYPSAVVDRGADIDPADMEADFLDRIMETPGVVLENGAELTADSLHISIKLTLQEVITGNYKVACVVTQDGMTGTASGWAQSNYYASGSYGAMGGYEDLPSTVPASQMVYDHVARIISPNFVGYPNATASLNMIGDAVIYNFSFPIGADWDTDKMHIVGIVNKPNGKTENASYTTIDEAVNNGYLSGARILDVVELDIDNSEIKVFPNPASDLAYVQLSLNKETEVAISLKNMQGQTIQYKTYGTLSGGYQLPIETIDLAKGIYILDVQTGTQTKSLKLVVE
jgi:thiol-disulfide isomerase/thioredoxin